MINDLNSLPSQAPEIHGMHFSFTFLILSGECANPGHGAGHVVRSVSATNCPAMSSADQAGEITPDGGEIRCLETND